MSIFHRIIVIISIIIYSSTNVRGLDITFVDLDTLAIDNIITDSISNVDEGKNDSISTVVKILQPSYNNSIIDNIASIENTPRKWVPNSNTAMLWGLLPGGGQIYNRKYWKLPIVWGAFTTCIYAMRFNQQRFNEYHDAYRDMSSSDPSKNTAWLAFTPRGTKPEDYGKYKYLLDNFRRGDEYFHRWRDISIVATIGVYALSIIDAYVDAELATFDISPDLSMKLYPKLEQSITTDIGYNLAIGCSLTF